MFIVYNITQRHVYSVFIIGQISKHWPSHDIIPCIYLQEDSDAVVLVALVVGSVGSVILFFRLSVFLTVIRLPSPVILLIAAPLTGTSVVQARGRLRARLSINHTGLYCHSWECQDGYTVSAFSFTHYSFCTVYPQFSSHSLLIWWLC